MTADVGVRLNAAIVSVADERPRLMTVPEALSLGVGLDFWA